MKNLSNIILVFGLLLIGITNTSCKKEKPKQVDFIYTLQFQANSGNEEIQFGKTYISTDGQKYTVNTLAYYISRIQLIKEDGTAVSLAEVVVVNHSPDINSIDQGRDKNLVGTSFSFSVPGGNYKELKFVFGLDAGLNGKTNFHPENHPASHPFGNERGLSWSMDGYMNLRFEGLCDTTLKQDGKLERPFKYHTLCDTLYRHLGFPVIFNTAHTTNIILDINKVFSNAESPILIRNQNVTDMNPIDSNQIAIGSKLTNNTAKAFRIK